MMNTASVTNRAAVIKEYLSRLTSSDAALIFRYATVAARWEALRLMAHQGRSTPGDDAKFRELSDLMRRLTAKLPLESDLATEGHCGPDGIPGLTAWDGNLPLELGGLLRQSWQESASGW
jgi:hypothetical protein